MTSTKSAGALASGSSKRTGERSILQRVELKGKGGRASTAGSRSTSRGDENRGGLLPGLVGKSGSVEAEDSSAEADDEDDAVLSIPRQLATSKGNGNGKGANALNRRPKTVEGCVPDRPFGRLWLDHVAGTFVLTLAKDYGCPLLFL
jgi:hypothetical protein